MCQYMKLQFPFRIPPGTGAGNTSTDGKNSWCPKSMFIVCRYPAKLVNVVPVISVFVYCTKTKGGPSVLRYVT